MSLTRGNIALDLNESPYKYVLFYGEDESIEFIFSSRLYRDKFAKKVPGNRLEINGSLSNRFKIKFKADKLADLKLYRQIEKRGFLIILEGGIKVSCVNNLLLNGEKMILKNLQEQ